jgi:hypothetical protein
MAAIGLNDGVHLSSATDDYCEASGLGVAKAGLNREDRALPFRTIAIRR